MLCQPAMVEDSLACTEPLPHRRPLLCWKEETGWPFTRPQFSPKGLKRTALYRAPAFTASQPAAMQNALPSIQQAHPAWNRMALYRAPVFTGLLRKRTWLSLWISTSHNTILSPYSRIFKFIYREMFGVCSELHISIQHIQTASCIKGDNGIKSL
jgi:hypothetical protein